jgi:hypothetical protein
MEARYCSYPECSPFTIPQRLVPLIPFNLMNHTIRASIISTLYLRGIADLVASKSIFF